MVHNKNSHGRRTGALTRLKAAKFTPKTLKNGHERTQEEWQARVAAEISTLEARLGVR